MSINPDQRVRLLEGKYAAVACSPGKSLRLLNGLREMGARVDALPVISIQELEDPSALDAALGQLDSYSWIIFTSSYAVAFFVKRLRRLGIKEAALRQRSVCAVGPGTQETLREHGIEVSLVPEEFVAEGVLEALAGRHGGLKNLAGAHILIPRAMEGRDLLPRELAGAGACVDVVPCYRTVPGRVEAAILSSMRAHAPDLLVFTSSSTVRNFVSILGEPDGTRLLQESTVAALGSITAATVEEFGRKPEILPVQNTIPSLLEAIREFYCRS